MGLLRQFATLSVVHLPSLPLIPQLRRAAPGGPRRGGPALGRGGAPGQASIHPQGQVITLTPTPNLTLTLNLNLTLTLTLTLNSLTHPFQPLHLFPDLTPP